MSVNTDIALSLLITGKEFPPKQLIESLVWRREEREGGEGGERREEREGGEGEGGEREGKEMEGGERREEREGGEGEGERDDDAIPQKFSI